jgi:two-component system NtrC family sensor kinase
MRPDAAKQAGSLAVLSEIASRLAEGGEIVGTVGDVIERLHRALNATEVSLWLYASGTLRRSAITGAPFLTVNDVQGAVEKSPPLPGLVARRLLSRDQRIGILAVGGATALTGDANDVLTIVANLLAPWLAHAEDMHRLTGEVARSEQRAEDERRMTARIIDALPLGLYVIDREYRIQAWNSNREIGSQGVSREHAMGKLIFDVLHRQSPATLRAQFDEVFTTGRMQQFNIDSEGSGQRRTYRISKIPMRIDNGDVTHVISIGEDITEWTMAQERWAQSEKLAAIGQLAAGVMHEINNPLATVAACAESLSLRLGDLRTAGVTVPPEADDFTRIIGHEVQRCKRIIDSLLTFSRPQSVANDPTDLNAVVDQAIFLVKHHTRFKKLRLQTILDSELPPVPASSEQLIQVIMALLINAADAMDEQGSITIRTRRGISDAEAAIVEVIDEGSGIPRADLPKIFEPFYTTKPPGRGTGLGLSVCYSIIAGHGGRIEVDSALGAGSTFRVMLPNERARTPQAPAPMPQAR